VISPLLTAATTAALRRATHLLVVGGGSPSVGDPGIGNSLARVSTGQSGEAVERGSKGRDPLIVNSSRAIASVRLLPPRSTGLFLMQGNFRFFHDFLTILGVFVTNFFEMHVKSATSRRECRVSVMIV
jgi:hypothetical protein